MELPNLTISDLKKLQKKFINPNAFLTYGFTISISVVSIGISLLLFDKFGTSSFPIIFIPAIVLSTWYGNFREGIVATAIVIIGAYYQFYLFDNKTPMISPEQTISLLLLLLCGILISYVVTFCKNLEKVSEYKKREVEYLEELMKMKNDIKKANEQIKSRDEFLSIASHELKTPLTSMLLQLQVALHNIRHVSLADFSVDKLLKMLESAESQSKRVSKMINDLLNVSLITTGKIELEKEKINLADLTHVVLEQFNERLKKENITISLIEDKEVIGMFDKLRMEQIIINLISNAIRYGQNKPIIVAIQKHNSIGIITVKDEGIGIPVELQQLIFDRFGRGVSSQQFKGLGVGLYITSQIVKAHGGSIRVDSKVGKGATFIIELPLGVTK